MTETKQDRIKFKYVIPEDLRDYYVNGMWGGVTPRGEIHMQFYNERHPIPKSITHKINNDTILGEVLEHDKGGDVVRAVQTSVVMDLSTAIAIRDWLNEKIDILQKQSTGGTVQ